MVIEIMALDLMHVQNIYCQMVVKVNMLFLGLIWAHLCILIIKIVLGEGPTQGLNDTTLTAEAKYHTNYTQWGKRVVLSLHYNKNNSLLLVNETKMYKIKVKDS